MDAKKKRRWVEHPSDAETALPEDSKPEWEWLERTSDYWVLLRRCVYVA